MNKYLTSLMGVAAVVSFAPAAFAADFVPGDANFQVSGNPFDGPVSANIGNSGIGAGNFTDTFTFTIGQNGVGSGSLTTNFFGNTTNLDFKSVIVQTGVTIVNGIVTAAEHTYTATLGSAGNLEFADLGGVAIVLGQLNRITVNGFVNSNGNRPVSGSYGGQINFAPTITSVPELGTWGMLILGFAAAGAAMRYRRRSTKVSFA